MSNGYIQGRADTEWWMREIRKGIAWRKKKSLQTRWADWRRWYRGEWNPRIMPVNLFFRMVRTTVPRIYFRNPSISVTSTMPGIDMLALSSLVERLDNKLIRSMKMKRSMKDMVQNTFLFGTGVGKLGYGSQYAVKPEDLGETTIQYARGSTKERIEYSGIVKDNFPWYASVHPGNFIVPEGTRRFHEARWSAVWMRRPLDDVKADARFRNVKGLTEGSYSKGRSIFEDQSGGSMLEDQEGMIDLVEIRDTKMQKAIVLAPYATNKILLETSDVMQVGSNMPNYVLVFNEDDECMWGVPDSVILEPQQLELNEIRTLQMKHRRVTLLKILYKKGAIESEQLQKLLDGEVLAGVEVKGDLSDIEKMLVGDIPQSLFAAGQEVINDVRENLGFSRNQFGNYAEGSADRTAYEARIVQEAVEIRVDERRDMVADLLVDTMQDINRIIFDKWDDDLVEMVMGPDALPVWVTFKPSMLKAAEYELNIDPDSALPETRATREQKALALYERFKTNPLINPFMLTKFLLHETQGVVWDHMLQVAQMARPGQPGGTAQQPMNVGQYMQLLAQNQQAGGGAGG